MTSLNSSGVCIESTLKRENLKLFKSLHDIITLVTFECSTNCVIIVFQSPRQPYGRNIFQVRYYHEVLRVTEVALRQFIFPYLSMSSASRIRSVLM